jgi:hypothetical protein
MKAMLSMRRELQVWLNDATMGVVLGCHSRVVILLRRLVSILVPIMVNLCVQRRDPRLCLVLGAHVGCVM